MLDDDPSRPPTAGPSVEAERLDAIEGMAAGVAHHLNNILMVALGNIQLALKQRPVAEDQASAARLRTAETAVRDAAAVVGSLTSFCRTEPFVTTTPLDLNGLIGDVMELTAPRWRDEPRARSVSLEVRVDHDAVGPVMGDAAALRQALMNLVFNAVEAMPDGGSLTLRTWADETEVHVAVSDTGVGMNDEVRARALEPFMTTKGPKTRGLGLAVAHGIVTRHGGRLTLGSLEGLGTSAVMSLPHAIPPSPRA